jgi:hypothetical protein
MALPSSRDLTFIDGTSQIPAATMNTIQDMLVDLWPMKPHAWGRVAVSGGVSTLVSGSNVASAVYDTTSITAITFTDAASGTNYAPIAVAYNTHGHAASTVLSASSFQVQTANAAGSPTDLDFVFVVMGG